MTDRLQEIEQRLQGLMIAGSSGDAGAYRQLLDELAARLRAYFRRRLSARPDDCEDLVQETLIAVHTRRHTYDAGQPLTGWVFAIARYKLTDWFRRRGRREALHDPVDDRAEELFVDAEQDASDSRRDVMEMLRGLPARQREPILLVKIEGLTVAEASARTGMSPSAVKIGVHRGLKALAERFRQE